MISRILAPLALMTVGFQVVPGAANEDEVPTISLEQVREKHQLPNSRYLDIDGISIHYVDEGVTCSIRGAPVELEFRRL